MRKIKDRIILGVVSGIIGGIPGALFNSFEYKKGLVDVKYGQMAASLFTTKDRVNTFSGRTLGKLANFILTSTLGTAITYTLSTTGRDYAITKGMGIASLYWYLLFGVSPRLIVPAKSKKASSNLLSLVDHLVFGAFTSVLITKLGDDPLFRDNNKRTPLIRLLNKIGR
ncbi:hypothetical protein [Natranaerobius trueperi]|uniref:DUF1440 domain-containing protein n=1 Tax=Natranaerobius trueperi TaxID=759412 RepID=A0A226BVU9_9FIRM|nr:hypothetical protein [Natranaerobius trueperi]OWZ83021.1 hypothetical protein CDO51_10680 [Natranaerobius trueperi]